MGQTHFIAAGFSTISVRLVPCIKSIHARLCNTDLQIGESTGPLSPIGHDVNISDSFVFSHYGGENQNWISAQNLIVARVITDNYALILHKMSLRKCYFENGDF